MERKKKEEGRDICVYSTPPLLGKGREREGKENGREKINIVRFKISCRRNSIQFPRNLFLLQKCRSIH
jgi:hypothetical protein